MHPRATAGHAGPALRRKRYPVRRAAPMCAALQSIDFDKRFHGSGGYGIFRRGGAYPKGTGSTSRSYLTGCRWRCSALFPSVAEEPGGAEPRPYGQNRDRSQPMVPFLKSVPGQRRDTQVPPYKGNVTPFVGRRLCVPPCRVSILINDFMAAGGTVYFVGADDSVRPRHMV